LTEALLRLSDVGVQFGGLKAVDGVSLSIPPGQRRAIIGPNGAGKTTLFNAITGMVPPTTGTILFDGHDITRLSIHRRARLGLGRTFQITNLFPRLTVAENLRLALRGPVGGKFAIFAADRLTPEQATRAEHALAVCRMDRMASAKVADLSYGEQRQLELAMALTASPRLLFLDEPAAGLSPAERGIVATIIRDLPRTLTLVLIEHDMDLVLSLVDYVTCLNQGRLLTEAAPEAIRSDPDVRRVYLGTPHHA